MSIDELLNDCSYGMLCYTLHIMLYNVIICTMHDMLHHITYYVNADHMMRRITLHIMHIFMLHIM